MRDAASTAEAVTWLRSPAAIRVRCGQILIAAEDDRLRHFALDPERLDSAADYVIGVIRKTYPTLDIPYHSRWRHFATGGRDRWAALAAQLTDHSPQEIARIRFDLVVLSVLLDAGAGAAWRYVEPATGAVFARSEGLAVASFDLFASGLCSNQEESLRADADALMRLDRRTLARAFQVRDDNPLVGLEGRVQLLNQLGATLLAQPERFGRTTPRIGGLFDHLAARALAGRLPAPAILAAVLDGFGAIWPGRIELGGINLGDAGPPSHGHSR